MHAAVPKDYGRDFTLDWASVPTYMYYQGLSDWDCSIHTTIKICCQGVFVIKISQFLRSFFEQIITPFRRLPCWITLSWSQNQNKKLIPTQILQIAQTNSFTWVTSWIVKVVWKRLSCEYPFLYKQLRWNLWRSECSKNGYQFPLTESSFSKFTLGKHCEWHTTGEL